MKRSSRAANALWVMGAIACSASDGGSDEFGQIQIAITEVPIDVRCISLVATGATSLQRDVEVVPGESSIIAFSAVPVGSFQLSGEAFSTECASTPAGALANWTGGPEQAIVQPGQTTSVLLRMRRTGDLSVGVDFEDGDLCAGITCDDGVECTVETCDPATGSCTSDASGCTCTSDADCDDGSACTVDTCDPSAGCVHQAVDGDADGFGPGACGGDCNDANPTIRPGAAEIIGDGIDQNCDGAETCFRDGDGDGFRTSTIIVSADADCVDPGEAGATAPIGDCCDSDIRVHPGVSAFFMTPSNCGSFDYNCDGTSQPQFGAGSCAITSCALVSGFATSTACGASGAFIFDCTGEFDPELGMLICAPETESRIQACR
jgi:hypothetical protein